MAYTHIGDGERHSVFDADKRFTINAITRAIRNQTEGKTVLMQGDHDSEVFTFECPRYVEGHDMARSTEAQVHFDNEGNRDRYVADDLAADPSDDAKVTFTWKVSGNATGRAGKLSFNVKFRCYDGAEITYEWNSDSFELDVKPSKNNDKHIAMREADAIAQMREDLESHIEKTFDSRLKVEKWTFTLDDGTKVEKEVWVP